MPEKRAVLFLLGLAVAGQGARLLLQQPAEPPGELLGEGGAGSDPASHLARVRRLSRPLATGESVDVNTAPAEEIARLPRIGMSLAKRLVAYRTANGPFRSRGDLDRVPGVGPVLLSQFEGQVRFGGDTGGALSPPGMDLNRRTASSYETTRGRAGNRVNLNSGDEADLVALPGVGPVRARAILAYRREKGPFAAVSDLRAVPGFGQALVARLAPLVVVR